MNSTQKILLATAILFLMGGLGLLSYDRLSDKGLSVSVLFGPENIRERDALASLREAEEYLRQNSSDSAKQALVICNRVLSQNISQKVNDMARFGLGVALERLNDRAAALEHYRKLKADGVKDPSLADHVDYRLGKLLLEINREEEGRSLLEGLLARTKDNRLKSDIHTVFAQFYLRHGQRQKAKENFNIALRYNPDNLQAELGQAGAAGGSSRNGLAYEYYDEYLLGISNLDPEGRSHVVTGLRNRAYEAGVRAYRSGRYDDAIYHFRKVISSYPDSDVNEKATYWLAESYAHSGKTDMAMKLFDRVLKNANPIMDQAALIKKGILLYQKGDLERALAAFYKAQENYPDGKYTRKASQWRAETEAQIRDNRLLKDYLEKNQSDNRGDSDTGTTGGNGTDGYRGSVSGSDSGDLDEP